MKHFVLVLLHFVLFKTKVTNKSRLQIQGDEQQQHRYFSLISRAFAIHVAANGYIPCFVVYNYM